MTHLHTHSIYSLRDSIIKPEILTKKVLSLGQTAVAVTDHGGLYSGTKIYKQCLKDGVKYIHGCEIYTCDSTQQRDKDNKYYHLVVLCKNEIGRLNLNRLITIANRRENFYMKPRVDFDILSQYGEGLVILTACLAGELCKRIQSGDDDGADKFIKRYHDRFGEDFYLEIQARNDFSQVAVNKIIVGLAKKHSVPLVVTTDAHYANQEDSKLHSRYAFGSTASDTEETYVDCFLQSEQEVRERLTYISRLDVNGAIRNTDIIADKCNVMLPLSAPIMPVMKRPEKYASNKDWLVALCAKGLYEKFGITYPSEIYTQEQKRYVERFEYELSSLERMSFIDYILLVRSYVTLGTRVGPGRGSGAGCLINYLVDITGVDPLEYGLYFERFVDTGSIDALESGEITASELKIPDIDVDFSEESCKDVLRGLVEMYGEDRIASIGRYGTQKTSGTIRDMCKSFSIPLEDENKIASAFKDFELREIDSMMSGETETDGLAADAISYVTAMPELFDCVRGLIGLPKSFGLHPCGKIIATRDIDFYAPSSCDSDGVRYLQADMHDTEDLGLVKVDILGLRTLDQMYDTAEMVGRDPTRESLDDEGALDIFRRGDTVGIFQMSSYGMANTLKKMNVRGVEDLAIANALYRPGAMRHIDSFCRRRNGLEPTEFIHEDMRPIVSNTHGVLIFQEQLIEIARLSGLHNPDIIRKAVGKKNLELMNSTKEALFSGLVARGWTISQCDKLWSNILEFASYGFNKSHAVAYARFAYMTAHQKAHHPKEFFCGLLNSYIGRSEFVKENADEILTDVFAHDVSVAPFRWYRDHRRCHIEDNSIVYAAPLIKGISESSAVAMWELAQKVADRGSFSLTRFLCDMVRASIPKNQIRALISVGVFDEVCSYQQAINTFDALEVVKFGEACRVGKEKANALPRFGGLIAACGSGLSAKGEDSAFITKINYDELFSKMDASVYADVVKTDRDILEETNRKRDLIGFAPLPSGDENDRPYLYVKKITDLRRKKDGKLFGYAVTTGSVGSGIHTRWTIDSSLKRINDFSEGDIILHKSHERRRGFLWLTSYRTVRTSPNSL